MAVSRQLNTVICVGILFHLSSVLSQLYSDDGLCSTPLDNITNGTLMGAVMAQEPCTNDFSECGTFGVVNISLDIFTYYGATTKVNISVPSNTKKQVYYYRLCRIKPSANEVSVLQCLQRNESFFITDVHWNVTGQNVLKVSMYNDSGYTNLMDCAYKNVLVANDSGLSLKVKLSQPKAEEETTTPVTPVGPVCKSSLSKTHYRIGNLTFKSTVNFTNFTTVYFKYSFGDGHAQTEIQRSNVSTVKHYYSHGGTYEYSVDAVVVLEDNAAAVHSHHKSSTKVYETLTEHTIKVGRDNSVAVGVSEVAVTLTGSFPVTYCWCMVFPNSTTCSRVPQINSTNTNDITCITVIKQSGQTHLVEKVKMNFTMSGTHHILANFTNVVDCKNESVSFYVYSPPSPVVIISSTTVGILAALLAFVVVVVIIIVFIVIPYRRYKYRMTETANFKFIELSESTTTIKGKVRRVSRTFADYFRPSRRGRVGLVNTESNDITSSNRLLDRNKVVTFTPYDSL